MGSIALQSWSRGASTSLHLLFRPVGSNPKLYDARRVQFDVRASSSRKSLKKLKRESQQGKDIGLRNVTDEEVSSPRFEEAQVDSSTSKDSIDVFVAAPRDKVLQACTVTSGLMAALGLIIRKASHVASTEGLLVPDCSIDVPCNISENDYVVY
jgi:hypothetical protein